MIRLVKPEEITEGDWLGQDLMLNKMLKEGHQINKEDLIEIRKANKNIMIKYGIPFIPVFLIGLILSLIFGDLIIKIVSYLVLL